MLFTVSEGGLLHPQVDLVAPVGVVAGVLVPALK